MSYTWIWFSFSIVCLSLTTVTCKVCQNFINEGNVVKADESSIKLDGDSFVVKTIYAPWEEHFPCGINNYQKNSCGSMFIKDEILGANLTQEEFTFKILVYTLNDTGLVYQVKAQRQDEKYLTYKWSLKRYDSNQKRTVNARIRGPESDSVSKSGKIKPKMLELTHRLSETDYEKRLEFNVALVGGDANGFLGFKVCNDKNTADPFFKSGGFILAPFNFISKSARASSSKQKTLAKTNLNIDEKYKKFLKNNPNIKDTTWQILTITVPFEVGDINAGFND